MCFAECDSDAHAHALAAYFPPMRAVESGAAGAGGASRGSWSTGCPAARRRAARRDDASSAR